MSELLFLLDTNVAIGYLEGKQPARQLIEKHGAHTGNSAVSQITRIELLSYWALAANDEKGINALLSAVTVIGLNDLIEQETIALRRRTRLKLPDAIIAATAAVHGLTLLTLDDKLHAAIQG